MTAGQQGKHGTVMRHHEHPACAHFLVRSLPARMQLARLMLELLPQAPLPFAFVSINGTTRLRIRWH